MALELSPGVNVVSYLRYKLLKLAYERRGEVTKDDLNRLGREVMLEIEKAHRPHRRGGVDTAETDRLLRPQRLGEDNCGEGAGVCGQGLEGRGGRFG
jgi:hypothetical protein